MDMATGLRKNSPPDRGTCNRDQGMEVFEFLAELALEKVKTPDQRI